MKPRVCERCAWPQFDGFRLCVWHLAVEAGYTRPPPIDPETRQWVLTLSQSVRDRWAVKSP